MGLVLPPMEAYQVQHLPIVKAYADKIGLVETINQVVPTEMAIDPGTILLGMILDTLSGRSPLYRLVEFFANQDTALLLGKAVAPEAFQDDTVGRVLDRLYDTGTMKVFTACSVRADAKTRLGQDLSTEITSEEAAVPANHPIRSAMRTVVLHD